MIRHPVSIFQLRLPPRFQSLAERFRPGSKEDRRAGSPGQHTGHHGPGGHWKRPLERAQSPWKCFLRILAMASAQRWQLAVLLILAVSSAILAMLSPLLMRHAVDSLIAFAANAQEPLAPLLKALAWMAAIYLLSAILAFFQGWSSEKLAQDCLVALRLRIYKQLQRLPLSYFDLRTHGEILSRATNDVAMVAQLMSRGIVSFIVSLLILFFALAAMLLLSPLLTLAALAICPVTVLLTKFIGKRLRLCFSSQQAVLGLMNGHIEEIINAQKIVKAFNHQIQALEDFRILNNEMVRVGLLARIMAGSIPPLMNQLNHIGFAILVGTGGYLAAQGSITVGVIAAFIQYVRQFNRPLNEIANQYNDIQSAIAGAERVFAVLDEPAESDQGTQQLPSPVKGSIQFEHVGFRYNPETPVLEDFNLNIAPGQKIALVGPTGAGKTTVASLLMRFYQLNSGSISIDGVPIQALPLNNLRQSIAVVLQDTWLFSGTIRDNIRYARPDASDDLVIDAAKAVGAHIFISRLPMGYDTDLGENGANLSQGQRQLLAIARAILANAPILILDEATSNVDTRTELIVQRAMLQLMKGRTCIIIAHRLSTIRDADAIIHLASPNVSMPHET